MKLQRLTRLNIEQFANFRQNRLLSSFFALLITAAPLAAQQATPYVSASDVVHHREQSIAWYRAVDATASMEGASNQLVLNGNVHQTALRAVEAGFDFARADAALLATPG